MPPAHTLERGRGFTLIELMIAVAVVAILAAIALPSYRQYVIEARRSDAHGALQRIQLAQEKWRTNHGAFASTPAELGLSESSDEGHYAITITDAGPAGYTATATAKADGTQAADVAACRAMSLSLADGVNIIISEEVRPCWKQ